MEVPWLLCERGAGRKFALKNGTLSHNSIARDHFAVKLSAQLRSSLLRLEVDLMDPEASLISVGALVVTQKAPKKISAHRHTFSNSPLQVRQVIAQIHDAAYAE